MELVLSSVSPQSFTQYFYSSAFSFINDERMTDISVSTSSLCGDYLEYNDFTNLIIDKEISPNYTLLLTETTNLSSILTTLSSNDSFGYSMREFVTEYNTEYNNFSHSTTAWNNTQFLLIEQNNKINIVPLNTRLISDPIDVTGPSKEYQKIYNVDDCVFLQYKTSKFPIYINPDQYNLIFNSYGVASSSINDYGFIESGAIAGDCPANSDVILFDTSEYYNYINTGNYNINPINNGNLFCLWLSSDSPSSNNKIWAERWFDVGDVPQGISLYSSINSLSAYSSIIDIPSNKIISEREKITYLRYGPDRNLSYIKSLSSNLIAHFDYFPENFSSDVNDISGFVLNYKQDTTDYLSLDGTNHAQIPPVDALIEKGDINLSLWVDTNNWNSNFDNQLFGNFANNVGYGVFYNNGTDNNLLSFPTSANNIFSMNYKGFKVFEKDLKGDLGLSAININYIKTDLFGNRWINDDFNKKIFKLENNDLVSTSIELSSTVNIVKMGCDSQNNLIIFDDENKMVSTYDSAGTFMSAVSVSSNISTFDILSDDTIVYDSADLLVIDNLDRKIKVVGSTLYINTSRVLHFPEKPNTLRIDLENNIWALTTNKLYKISSQGKIINVFTINTPYVDTNIEMCFVKSVVGGYDVVDLWILYNDNRIIIIVNSEGEIKKRIFLDTIFLGSGCSGKDINLRGDFSGFDNKRKFDRLGNTNISLTNSAITAKIILKCAGALSVHRLNYPTTFLNGWVHISFSVRHISNNTVLSLFINGSLVASKTLTGLYQIHYGNGNSPFIIGGNSGKLGSKNTEKSIINDGYFRGRVADIRLYQDGLTPYAVRALANNTYSDVWRPIQYNVPCPPITQIEEIGGFHINRYKGFKSNIFNIKIKNFTDDVSLQSIISNEILRIIDDIKPANTVLKDIIFE